VLDGFEKLANDYVLMANYAGDRGEKGFGGWQRGYETVAAGPWRELLAALDKLREAKRMGIVCLAHTGTGNFKNPKGPDYDRFVPNMHKYSWNATFGWADIVLFGYHETIVAKDKADRKAKGNTGQRIMQTDHDASADAKNRHALPPEIEMGSSGKEAFENFINALKHKAANNE
jgi:hypothetical protein